MSTNWLLDVTATLQGVVDLDLIDDLADECFMPLTVGGGIRSADEVGAVVRVGADKVCIGTAAVEVPDLIDEAASRGTVRSASWWRSTPA